MIMRVRAAAAVSATPRALKDYWLFACHCAHDASGGHLGHLEMRFKDKAADDG